MAEQGKFIQMPPLFGDLSPEELAKVLDEVGEKARSAYASTTKQLLAILAENDPVAILAVMGWRFFALQAGASDGEPKPAGQQHHLELLQALALTGQPPTTPNAGRLADTVQTVIDLLEVNAQAFNFSRMKAPAPGTEEKVKRQALLLEQIRGTTQFVRGEFHPHQLDRYLRSIFKRLDEAFHRVHGVTATALLDTLQGLLKIVEDRLNQQRDRGRPLLKAYKERKAVKIYFEIFPEDVPRRDAILADAAAKGVKPHQMRLFLLEEIDRFLPQIYSFDTADLAKARPQGSDPGRILKAFEAWSLAFGDLKDRPVDHLYLANPVWDRPFVRLANGKMFWPSPNTSLTFGFEMFEHLMARDGDLLALYEDARANLLENELGALLEKTFANGRVLRSLEWQSAMDGKNYENDAIVLIDRTALLFEAKSGKVSDEAKRGADRRLKREIAKLMVEPAEQSKRLMDLLSGERREHVFQTKTGQQTIDSRRIDRFIRVNVTFNVIGALSSHWPDLVDADLLEAGAVQIPTMSLADLDMVCEVLGTQAAITHYLRRRSEFEANADYFADESDLLAFYLRTGFNVGAAEFDGTAFMIYGMSDELSAYYKRQAEDQKPQRPSFQTTKLFYQILAALEQRQPEHWLELTDRLLNVAKEEQQVIERNVGPSVARVKKSREPSMSWSAHLANGPPQRKQAFVFVWYRCPDRESRDGRLRAHAVQAMEMAGTDGCLLVGFDTTRPAEPYSIIGIFKKPAPPAA